MVAPRTGTLRPPVFQRKRRPCWGKFYGVGSELKKLTKVVDICPGDR